MRYLLDTHAFIWMDNQPTRLSPRVAALCQNQVNTLLLSVASVWEMQIKLHLGKLSLPAPLSDIIKNQQQTNGIVLLPVELTHVLGLSGLPDHHKDPFDRLLVAQANTEKLTLITDDPRIAQYPVQVVW